MPNRVAFVTGASRGIGRAIALRLSKSGHDIVVASPELENNEAVAAEIRAAGGKAMTLDFNLTSLDSIKQGVAQAIKEMGKIDVLVNNAGITRDGLLVRMPEEQFDSVIAVNMKSVFNMMHHVGRLMMKARSGRIVSLASVAGLYGNPGQINYSASKAGIVGMTLTAAKELGPRGITANAVAPGFIETAMTASLPDKVKEAAVAGIALGRMGKPQDVANAVAFLASDEASYITGQVLVIDGGMVM